MSPLGVSSGTVLRLVREAGAGARPLGSLLVAGPLAPQLVRLLVEGGDAGLVRTTGDPASAAVVVCILSGAPAPEQLTMLRAATRAGVPTVAVQMGDAGLRVPYVLPEDVVGCPPGSGFPIEEIAAAAVRGLGRDAAALAAALPVLRTATLGTLTARCAAVAAGLAAAPWAAAAKLPLLVPLQARLLRDLDVAAGRQVPSTRPELGAAVGPELGAALAVGFAARTLVRRLPFSSRLVEAAVAAGGTLALGRLASRAR